MGVTAGQSFRWKEALAGGPGRAMGSDLPRRPDAAGGSRWEPRGGPPRPRQKKAADPRGSLSFSRFQPEKRWGKSGLIPVGTKARSPWDELSPKPVRPQWRCSRRSRGHRSAQPEQLRSRPPSPGSSRQRLGWRSAGRWSLTLATDWRQAGSDRQQQHPRRSRRDPALHRGDGSGPRRSFPGRWARVAAGTGRLLRSGTGVALSTTRWLLEAESPPRRLRHPVFYPRQSPPSRQCIKPSGPDRPGTSMRESSGPGPLLPGPPPALCDSGRSGHSNTCAIAHAQSPHARACACSHPGARAPGNTKRPHQAGERTPLRSHKHTHSSTVLLNH